MPGQQIGFLGAGCRPGRLNQGRVLVLAALTGPIRALFAGPSSRDICIGKVTQLSQLTLPHLQVHGHQGIVFAPPEAARAFPHIDPLSSHLKTLYLYPLP